MRKIKIVNPAAGQGDAAKYAEKGDTAEIYYTKCIGDAESYCTEILAKEPETHFIVYGGDGTVNEVVNGIMKANAGDKALLSVIPVGTGNDLVRSFEKNNTVHTLDVIKYSGRYAINLINIGFDCSVAAEAARLKTKPLISGSGAYIGGILTSIFKNYGEHIKVTVGGINGKEHETQTLEGDYLLCVIGNCSYYGGGFRAAPLASYNDGLLDILLVKKLPRRLFLSLVGDYKKGKHITEDGRPIKKFEKYLTYMRCTSITVEGITSVCADGEVRPAGRLVAEILKGQIRLMI